jgi:hypothetical protein
VDCGRVAYCDCERAAVESMKRLSCEISPTTHSSNSAYIRDYKNAANSVCGACSWEQPSSPSAEPSPAPNDPDTDYDPDTDSSGSSLAIIGLSSAAACCLLAVGAVMAYSRDRKRMAQKEAQAEASGQYAALPSTALGPASPLPV